MEWQSDPWCNDAQDATDALLLRWQREGRVARHNAKRVRSTLNRRNRDRTAIFERDGGVCHLCGEQAQQDYFDLDHVLPTYHVGQMRLLTCGLAIPRATGLAGIRSFSLFRPTDTAITYRPIDQGTPTSVQVWWCRGWWWWWCLGVAHQPVAHQPHATLDTQADLGRL